MKHLNIVLGNAKNVPNFYQNVKLPFKNIYKCDKIPPTCLEYFSLFFFKKKKKQTTSVIRCDKSQLNYLSWIASIKVKNMENDRLW